MAQSKAVSADKNSFRVLRPGTREFMTFFPYHHSRHESGELTSDAAAAEAYQQFRGWIESIAQAGHRVAKSEDFQHNVLVRFEDAKLAERFDPSLGSTPRAYVRGVSVLMAKERRCR